MPNESRIAVLFIRNALGTLTETEKQELNNWRKLSAANQLLYDQYSSSEQLAREFQKRMERNSKISAQLGHFVSDHQNSVRGRTYFMQKWKWIAASVVVLLGIGAYLLMQIKTGSDSSTASVNAAQISPGRDGAILTLADGSQLSLDSIQNGIIALQDGVTAKVVNGELVYEGAGKSVLYNTST